MKFNQPRDIDELYGPSNKDSDTAGADYLWDVAAVYAPEYWSSSNTLSASSSSVPVASGSMQSTVAATFSATHAPQPADASENYPSPSTSSPSPVQSYISGERDQYQTYHPGWLAHTGSSTSGIVGNLGSEEAGPSAHPTALNTPYNDDSSSRTSWSHSGPSRSYTGHPYPRPIMTPPPAQSAFDPVQAMVFAQPNSAAPHRPSRANARRTRQLAGHPSNPTLPLVPPALSTVFYPAPSRLDVPRIVDHLAAENVVDTRPPMWPMARTGNTEGLSLSLEGHHSQHSNAAAHYPSAMPTLLPAPGSVQPRLMGEPSTPEILSANHHNHLPPYPQVHLPVPSQPERRVASSSRVLRSTTQAERSQATRVDSSFETSGGGRKRKNRDDDEDAEERSKRATRKRKAGPSIPATRATTKGKERDGSEAAQMGDKQTARPPKTRKRTVQPKPDNDHDYVDDIPGMPREADVDVVPGMPGYVPNKKSQKRWRCLPSCTKDHDGSKIRTTFNRQVDRNRHFHTASCHAMDRGLSTQHTCPFPGCGNVLSRHDAVKRHLGRSHRLPPLDVQRWMQKSEEEEDQDQDDDQDDDEKDEEREMEEEYSCAKRPRGGRN